MNHKKTKHTDSVVALLLVPWIACSLVGCGGANTSEPPPAAPVAATAPPPKKAPPPPPEEPPAAPAAPAEPTPPPPEAAAEKCDGGWVCVKVSLDTKKVEPRETKLLGDPKIDATWSKTTDGRGPVSFDNFSKGPVEVMLRRKPNNKNEVTVKSGKGPEIVIDRHEGSVDDFTYIGLIAAEQGNAVMIDIRYMK